MTEPVKVLPMAKLLRLAREKEERDRVEREGTSPSNTKVAPVKELSTNLSVAQQTIPQQTIVGSSITQQTIAQQDIVQEYDPIALENSYPPNLIENTDKLSLTTKLKRKEKKTSLPQETIVQKSIVNQSKGYYPIYNDISDRIIPELQLNPYEQSVFQRLYRLSRGWKSDECEVGLGTLAKHCVMSRSQVQRSISRLIEKGLIENLGSTKKGGKEGNRYRVLSCPPTIPSQTIPLETIVQKSILGKTIVSKDETSVGENTVVNQGIVTDGTNKNNNKDLLNTYTQTDVGARSKFSLEECKRYAEHLQKTGQGISNPGGYATTIFRSGEADAQIEAFLNPPAPFEAGNCPDCGGSGYYYPEGLEKGVKLCKHEKLKSTG
jgi:hypothetical protein